MHMIRKKKYDLHDVFAFLFLVVISLDSNLICFPCMLKKNTSVDEKINIYYVKLNVMLCTF